MIRTTMVRRDHHEMLLSGRDIIQLLDKSVPLDAEVSFDVPGGGDYSNCSLDVTDECPIRITWTTQDTV